VSTLPVVTWGILHLRFAILSDCPCVASPPPVPVSAGSSTQPYFGTFSANNIYFSSTTSPYNTISYSPWSPTQRATAAQVPLSSYSSLNGATTTTSATSSHPTPQQQQYPHSPQPQQQMMIECELLFPLWCRVQLTISISVPLLR
jgi:protein phosphatase 1 regulatory subunit 10